MDGHGLNNDVVFGERRLHVQTSYLESSGRIVSTVFDNGRTIDKREISFTNGTAPSALHARLQEIHQQTINEFETLHYVSEKVYTVRHAGSAVRLGRLFLRKRLLGEAERALLLALESEPELIEAQLLLAHVYNLQSRHDEARGLLDSTLSSAATFADLHCTLGETLFFLRDYPAAVERFLTALELNPDFAAAHYHLATTLLARQQEGCAEAESDAEEQEEILQHLQRALKLAPELRTPEVKAVFGLLHEHKTDEALERLIAARPAPFWGPDLSFEDEFYLKFMYGGKGRDDDFIAGYTERLSRVLADYPGYADLHNNLGIAYLIQCRNLFLKALDEFRAALQINPEFERARKNLKIAENDGKGFLILLRALLK